MLYHISRHPYPNQKIREQINKEVEEFLKNGGQIEQIPIGVTTHNKDGTLKHGKNTTKCEDD